MNVCDVLDTLSLQLLLCLLMLYIKMLLSDFFFVFGVVLQDQLSAFVKLLV